MLLHRPCPDAAKQTHGVNHTPSPPADLTALQQPHHGCCIASHRAPCATVLPRLTLPRPHRQVQRKQFELQYASVAAELEEARRLNAELRAAVAVQEAVRENREAVESMLQAIARLQQGAQQHCSNACTCDAEGAASCWQLQPFQRRVALYIQVGRACEPMRQLVEHCSTGPELRSLEPSTKHELRQRMAHSMPMLVANVQSTTLAELMQEWAAFCEFATEVTSAVDGGRLGEAEGEERVRPALEYIAIVKQLSLMHNAETYRQMLLRTRLPGETEDTAAARWRQAALASGITREQAERMLPHYQLCMQRQAELGAALAGGMAALQRARQELAATHTPLHATLSGMAEQYVSLFEAGGAVEHQTCSAILILHNFMASGGRVMTPLQKARVARCCIGIGSSGQRTAVYPDVIAITREVLAHHSLLPPQPEQ